MKSFLVGAAFAMVSQLALLSSPALADGNMSTSPAASSSSAPVSTPVNDGWNPNTPYDTDLVEGSETAPVTVVEYASLTCPHCAAFQNEKYSLFKQEWIDTGKVKFIFRNFPIDQSAMGAAALLSCRPLSEQHEGMQALYKSVNTWAVGKLSETVPPILSKVAGHELTFDKDFADCVKKPGFDKGVLKPAFDGSKHGITGTPFFFVNGETMVGYSETSPRLLDDLVAKKLGEIRK